MPNVLRGRKAILAAVGLAAAATLAGSGWFLLGSAHAKPVQRVSRATPSALPSAVPSAAGPAVAPSTAASAGPSQAPATSVEPARLVIFRLGVQAPIETKGIDSHNVMESPDRPFDVAWYPFTAKPGSGGNAVFAGHRDFAGVGPAVFWHLGDVAAGDLIEVVGGDGRALRYRVVRTWDYDLATIPMGSVLAQGSGDQVTLMTCSGSYTRSAGYDHRFVVRAQRI